MQDPSLPTPQAEVPHLSRAEQWRYLRLAAAALAVLLVLAMVLRWLLGGEAPAPKPLPPGEVQLSDSQMAGLTMVHAGAGDDWQRTRATGDIAADESLSTPVFMPYGGQVTEVFVQAGARVAVGQPLLRVRTGDVVDARNALFAAHAARASATAQVRLAEANLARQKAIYETAGGAFKDYQQAQNDLVAAQSALRNAESQHGAARDKLAIFGKTPAEIHRLENARDIAAIHAETVLHAPISGVVATRAVSAGQYVSAGGTAPVLTIADPARVWLVAQLAESDGPRVHLGDPVDVTVAALPGRIFHAQIDTIAAALDPQSHRLPVRATIANPDAALKPQMFANFTIRHAQPAAPGHASVTVPASAVIHEGDAARVWVLVGKGRLRAQPVTVGDSVDGEVRILGGLKPGTTVVAAGSIFVNEAGLGQ